MIVEPKNECYAKCPQCDKIYSRDMPYDKQRLLKSAGHTVPKDGLLELYCQQCLNTVTDHDFDEMTY